MAVVGGACVVRMKVKRNHQTMGKLRPSLRVELATSVVRADAFGIPRVPIPSLKTSTWVRCCLDRQCVCRGRVRVGRPDIAMECPLRSHCLELLAGQMVVSVECSVGRDSPRTAQGT